MSTGKKISLLLMLLLLLLTPWQPSNAEERKTIYTILLKDLNGNNAWLPYIGEYPLIIIYEDFRNIDDNSDLYRKTLKQPQLYEKIKFIYISNTAPAWLTPDPLIYHYFRERENTYSKIKFLIDNNRSLQKKWRLLDSDKKAVIIVVSRDAEIIDIKYISHGRKGIEQVIDRISEIFRF